jgi:hypothetical protein
MVTEDDANNESLKKQLQETQKRLNQLENEGRIPETIVQTYGPSVCLLHVVVEFRDKDSGQIIRIASDAAGEPLVDEKGLASLETEGTGPPLRFDFFGTGFLVAKDGRLLTHHHVAEPWWSVAELLNALLDVTHPVITISAAWDGHVKSSGPTWTHRYVNSFDFT